jgi:shikimate dehydrogenase
MHNAAFAVAGIDAAYGALAVPTHRDLARLLRRAPALGLAGLSVTAPLKESAYRLCATRTPEAEQAQSVNTIRIGPEGAAGHNTDGMAALDIVANRLAQGRTIRGVLIVGSGGAARGLAGALASRYNVTLAARNTEARKEIGRRLDVRTLSLDEAAKDPAFDLLVNATSHDEPISLNGRDAALLDLRYGADPTPWQRHAHEHGLPFAGGREILWAQGVHAFHHWTGQEAPARLMAQALGVTP